MEKKPKLIMLSIFLGLIMGCGNGSQGTSSVGEADTASTSTDFQADASEETTSVDTTFLSTPASADTTASVPSGTIRGSSIPNVKNDTLDLNIQLSELDKQGIVVWNLPEYMTVGAVSIVNVRIAIGTVNNLKSITAGIDTSSKNSGLRKIEVSKKMVVSLLAAEPTDITIRSLDSIQIIPTSEYAQWTWAVVPQKAKKQYLILRVSKVDSMDVPKEIFSKEFEVKATIPYRAMQIWGFIKDQWITISAIITFLAGLFIRRKVTNKKTLKKH